MKPTRARLDKHGRIVIPAKQRRELGLRPGDVVTIRVEDCEVRVIPLRESIRRAQEIVRRYAPSEGLVSEELIRERRAEATRE